MCDDRKVSTTNEPAKLTTAPKQKYGFSAYYEDPNNKDAIKKLGIMTDSKLRSVISVAKDFNKSAKERYRCVCDNKPINL
ncbi:hypothetical protein MTZ49_07700 [Entomomonas sp. E2T0]|uniref:hypothetical protein n=1 Tax=Entomomonas sp. E2T0 TaxID=2930213 RepID=UPI00222833DD|nr:hypothetical protein [Entomomonas sp. E2T0]UYZ85423.1 hypothetical protein MTZ49_07700 [Entomomonas sp. E2T0]